MRTWLLLFVVVLAAGCASGDAPAGPSTATADAGDVAAGEEAYAANCAQCHGVGARGTDQGPTFLSDIYVPSHHADAAFLLAVRNGVRPHHWDFGPMPPRPDVTNEQVADIVAYVRALQREEGLIE